MRGPCAGHGQPAATDHLLHFGVQKQPAEADNILARNLPGVGGHVREREEEPGGAERKGGDI